MTNSNFLGRGVSASDVGSVILQDIFTKDNGNGRNGVTIQSANSVVMKSLKSLSSSGSGVSLSNIQSLVMDDVLVASNSADGIFISTTVKTSVLKDIVVLDNEDEDLEIEVDDDNSKVTIENLVACNTGNVGDPLVYIDVPDGVLDITKDFVATNTACAKFCSQN